jgi:hypothetical protein
MPEYLNSNRNKKLTQEDIKKYVADEPDRRPFSGAGSMNGRWNLRGENPEPAAPRTPTPEELKIIADALELSTYNQYLAQMIREGKPVEHAWSQTFGDAPCLLFQDVPSSMDRLGFESEGVATAAVFLRDSNMFAAYRASEGDTARAELMRKVSGILLGFIHTNYLDATSPQSWMRAFIMLRNFGLLPAPLPTQAQLDNAPASDGNPVAYHDDGITPVTYTVRGQLKRYSNEMLQALTSAGYETVMGLRRIGGRYGTLDPQVHNAAKAEEEAQKPINNTIADDGNPVAILDGEYVIVNGKAYSNLMLDKMSGDDYRILMRLGRDSSRVGAMAPQAVPTHQPGH